MSDELSHEDQETVRLIEELEIDMPELRDLLHLLEENLLHLAKLEHERQEHATGSASAD